MEYNPRKIETKWQNYWREHAVYRVSERKDKPKYYVLDMFPYPSGAGLHVGHPLGYIASDIFSRFKRHEGYNVLHPMGYDAFGLPAEQYAIQTGVHPAESTAENIAGFRKQMDNIGFSYDWSREVNTSDPIFYKWTQWIFKKLFEHYYDIDAQKAKPIEHLIQLFATKGSDSVNAAHHLENSFSGEDWNNASKKQQSDWLMCYRLAYRKEGFVNWCEALGTVLANDEIKDGVSERGGHPVSKKSMNQWYLRTTAYAPRLLEGLDQLDWPESLKIMQRNWIGKSEGASINFSIQGHDQQIEIFTTRPDTIFGATFMVLAPEHELVLSLCTTEQKSEIESYKSYVQSRSDRDRLSEVRKISGAFTGAYAIHPFTNEPIPIWISEYVLKDYGTGAIMAVPAEDLRDQAFAKHFELPIMEIVDRSAFPNAEIQDKIGHMINSDFLNGLSVLEAIDTAIKEIGKRQLGFKQLNFKLRDANFSRQRYWGEPFPIVYDQDNVAYVLEDDELPLELPTLSDFKPTSSGQAPLTKAVEWISQKPGFRREVDTMPGFAGSSWYFLRYMDPFNEDNFCSPENVNYWKDVDLYIGGAEHAVGHLLYSRTWHKFLFDLGLTPTDEPFKKLINQGMIQGMSAFIYASKTPLSEIFYKKDEGWKLQKLYNPKFIFLSSDLVSEYPGKEVDFIRIHVPIEWVSDHGKQPYIDQDAIKKLTAYRPEWQGRVFVGADGIIDTEDNTKKDEGTFKLYLVNEVEKMSKSKYNVVNPDLVIDQYGADCFRMYEMFLGPIEQSKPWDTNGIDGVSKFLRKFWSLFYNENGLKELHQDDPTREELRVLHTLIKKVSGDIELFSFNTCVSAFMIAVNELKRQNCTNNHILSDLVVLISPFAPHIASELWDKMGNSALLQDIPYPVHEEKWLESDEVNYPVCINGKKKTLLPLPADMSTQDIESAVRSHSEFEKWLDGKSLKKVIVVPGKMINLVV
jgi:leucyl-tRNA synthetase